MRFPQILFALHLFEIPTQSVVHCEFICRLPGVQCVKRALYAMKPLNVVVPDSCAVHQAQSEAGETIAEAGSIKVLSCRGRLRRFIGAEIVGSGRRVVVSAKQLMTEIAAEFESVAAVNPDRGFSVVVIVVNEWSVVDSQIREGRVVYGWGTAQEKMGKVFAAPPGILAAVFNPIVVALKFCTAESCAAAWRVKSNPAWSTRFGVAV